MQKIVFLNGQFDDQKGLALQGEITGYNGDGIPCRKYTWVNAKLEKLNGKSFEAFDTQIKGE